MPTLISCPTIIYAAGNKPKRMVTAEGWQEPGQRPEFQEITLVLRGTLRVEHESGVRNVYAGQAVVSRPGGWVRDGSAGRGGARRDPPPGVFAGDDPP